MSNRLLQVGQEEWDACATGCGEVNPFLLWTFLHCLEESGSAVRVALLHSPRSPCITTQDACMYALAFSP